MRPNAITYRIIGGAMRVHSDLGPGLLESAYEKALSREFERTGLHFRRQVPMTVDYAGVSIAPAFKLDFIVEDAVVLEIKSVESVLRVHRAQLLSYLKLSGLPLGLILNFKVAHLRDGIVRLINAPESRLE